MSRRREPPMSDDWMLWSPCFSACKFLPGCNNGWRRPISPLGQGAMLESPPVCDRSFRRFPLKDFAASKTALATSLMRAVHTRLDPKPLIDDPWGDRLVPESAREMIRRAALHSMDAAQRAKAMAAPDDIVDAALRRSPAYANVIARTRYAEDALETAVGFGVRQYILVGAGFDSFFLRRPVFAADLEIFEIDHPATQGLKRERIKELGISL